MREGLYHALPRPSRELRWKVYFVSNSWIPAWGAGPLKAPLTDLLLFLNQLVNLGKENLRVEGLGEIFIGADHLA